MRKKEKARLELDEPRVGEYLKWLDPDCGMDGRVRQGVGRSYQLIYLIGIPPKNFSP